MLIIMLNSKISSVRIKISLNSFDQVLHHQVLQIVPGVMIAVLRIINVAYRKETATKTQIA